MSNLGLIYQQIPKVMASIEAIAKGRDNIQQGYKFRGIDDVYKEVKNVFAEHKIFTTTEVLDVKREERQTSKGGHLIYSILKVKFTFYAEDGSNVYSITIGEGMDSGDKASNKAMAIAHKYAITQIFVIPTEDAKDPEHDSHYLKPEIKSGPYRIPFDGPYKGKALHEIHPSELDTYCLKVEDSIHKGTVREPILSQGKEFLERATEYFKTIS